MEKRTDWKLKRTATRNSSALSLSLNKSFHCCRSIYGQVCPGVWINSFSTHGQHKEYPNSWTQVRKNKYLGPAYWIEMAVQNAGQRCANNTWPPWANLVFENVALVSLTQNQCTQALVMKTQMCDGIRPKDVAEIMPFPGRKLGEKHFHGPTFPCSCWFWWHTGDKSMSSQPGEPVLLFLHHGHKDLFLHNSEENKMPVPVLVLPKTSDLTSQKSNHGYFQPQPPYPLCRFATV